MHTQTYTHIQTHIYIRFSHTCTHRHTHTYRHTYDSPAAATETALTQASKTFDDAVCRLLGLQRGQHRRITHVHTVYSVQVIIHVERLATKGDARTLTPARSLWESHIESLAAQHCQPHTTNTLTHTHTHRSVANKAVNQFIICSVRFHFFSSHRVPSPESKDLKLAFICIRRWSSRCSEHDNQSVRLGTNTLSHDQGPRLDLASVAATTPPKRTNHSACVGVIFGQTL